ncbi:hypothetical protein SAMN06265375_10265 [Muriicola jejuensis]|uniref:Uncharacterized protein n=1 Tax=Muriicola jejuensis TaxID=504488 RepID=A0A6P0UIM2_9FLAO|nr:DUF6515 family protein [Muriicola jejuensis]NER10953.1 hypothetical protein [Muriicola jejuensis]SMP15127.1 hypothetical protein SAMN06265375_10265 [Muriicola jejuensis]
MKKLRIILIIAALFGTLSAANAQRVVKVYPRHGTVVTTIHNPRLVIHKGIRYHLAAGVWYKARGRNYIVCAAPRGIVINTLPKGHRVVYVKGRRYYAYKGVHYQRFGRTYKVVYV